MNTNESSGLIDKSFNLNPIREDITDWAKWLIDLHNHLTLNGFRKFNQTHKSATFIYYKKLIHDDEVELSSAFYVYDFRKHIHLDPNSNYISIMPGSVLIRNDRVTFLDLDICDIQTVDALDNISKDLNKLIIKYT